MTAPEDVHARCHQWAADAYDHGYADGLAAARSETSTDAADVSALPDTSWVHAVRVGHDNDPPTWWDRCRGRRSGRSS